MIKLFQDKKGRINNFCASFFSQKYFYDIVNIVKKHPSKLENKEWKLNINSYEDLISDLHKIVEETIHVNLDVVKGYALAADKLDELMELRNSLEADSGIRFKKPFSPLPFQHVGIKFISIVRNGLIADKVGLGKTIQGFGSAMKLRDLGILDKSIIVATATLKRKWHNDIHKFTEESSIILEGTAKKRKSVFKDWINSSSLFLIVSYDTLRRDWDNYMDYEIKNIKYGIILDEVQKVKNTRSKRSKAIRSMAIKSNCESVVGLSATYVETGLSDLFGIMYVIDQTIFGSSYMQFAEEYLLLDWHGKIIGAKNAKQAAKKMKAASVRRTKSMVQKQLSAKLPKVNESTIWVELSKEEKRCYNDVVDGLIEKFEIEEKANKISNALPMTLSLLVRQASLSTEMLGYHIKKSSKIEALLDLLPEIIESEKVVVFCFFTDFLDMLERELNKKGIKTLTMHGKRKEANVKVRQDNIDKFQESKDVNVLLASDILAEGVDIPAASYVINMDTLWNPAKLTQRAGRIDRLIQKSENIYVINILTTGTVEEGMYDVVNQRYALALDIMDDGKEESRIKKIPYDDMKKIILKRV